MEILSLGEKIKERRKKLGMTLKDLAGDRITPGQISLVESGKSNPSMDLLEYLAEKLNVSTEYLMESEETQAERICLFYENIAESYIINNDLVNGQQNIESAFYYADKYNLEYRKAKSLFLTANIHMLRGEEILAQQYFLSSNVIFIKNNCYEEVISTFIKLGEIAFGLKAYHSANSYFQQAEKVFIDNKIANDFFVGKIYYYMAITYLKLNDIDKAINYTYLSKEKFKQINDKERYAKSIMLLSKEYANSGQIHKAIKYSHKSLKIFKELKDIKHLGEIENDLGNLFADFDNLEEAFIHLNKAKQLRSFNGDIKLMETLIDMCKNYIKIKNIDNAKKILNEIKEQINRQINNEFKDKDNLYINNIMLEAYLLKHKINKIENNIEEAQMALLEALEIAKKNKMQKKYAEISIFIGNFYIENCDQKKASEYLINGVNVFKDLGIIKDF